MIDEPTSQRSERSTAAASLFAALVLCLSACTTAPRPSPTPPSPTPTSQDLPSRAQSSGRQPRPLELVQESLEREEDSPVPYDRGRIEVPANRVAGSTATLGVEFFRFPRDPEAPAGVPPIFLLRGGPGFRGLGPLLERPGFFAAQLAPYTRIAEVVVPGQRGFGSSGATPCEPMRELTVEEAMDTEARARVIHEATALCRQKWEDHGLDLGGLNVVEAAADVADIARALGYEKIQLVGTSFGSHWAMTVLRYHPERIARATLGGLEGPDHTYDMPGGVAAALERIAGSAEASRLAPRIPPEGLLAAYRALIRRAEADPFVVETKSPRDGEVITVHLGGDDLRALSRGYTFGTGARHRLPAWPIDLLTLLEGKLEGGAQTLLRGRLSPRLRDAAYYQMDCASGISRARGERLRGDPAADLVGPLWLHYDTVCAAWDADLGEAFRAPFETEIPAVLVQGDWDTSTPFENALELRRCFREHRFVHVEEGSHGALREALEIESFRAALEHWLATGELDQVPERVELPPVRWPAP